MNYFTAAFKKYAVFNGRATRAEYWYFALINLAISVVLAVLDATILPSSVRGMGILGGIYALAAFVPGFALSVRRLHDTNHSGWWLFLCLIPLVGPIILLVFMATDSQPSTNQYGPNPKAPAAV
jgi:uncharacterized membrane protein YhaH (DUF805 family)